MKKYPLVIGLTFFTALFIIFLIFFFNPTNKQVGQPFWSDSPVLQKLEINQSPAEIEGPTPPKGFSREVWNKEFSYRLTGELKNFDKNNFEKRYPKSIGLIHVNGSITIYMMEIPDPEEVGPYRRGRDL